MMTRLLPDTIRLYEALDEEVDVICLIPEESGDEEERNIDHLPKSVQKCTIEKHGNKNVDKCE